jgi:hypothetical protein
MKKIIYSLMLLAGSQAFSQMTITSHNPYNANDVPELIESGSIWITNTVEEQGGELYFFINNAYDEDIYIRARVESITNDEGNNFQFCFGENCVFSITEGNEYTGYGDYVTIPEGGTNSMWDKIYNGNAEGATPKEFTFTFFRVDSLGNELDESLTITYMYDPTASVADLSLQQMGVAVNNTLVKNAFSFSSENNLTVEVFDLNGKNVANYKTDAGQQTLDLSSLQNAVYIVKFASKEGKTAYSKIVKQ